MRRWRVALATGLLAASLSAMALAAPALWTLTVMPPAATQGTSTTFTFTLTNGALGASIGCAQVDLPSSFAISSVSSPDASNGETWLGSRNGNSVVVRSQDGGGRLGNLQSVTFKVTAKPTLPGLMQIANHVHHSQDCLDGGIDGPPLTVTVLPAVVATPTPTATSTPRPSPTATPSGVITPTPTPTPTTRPTPGASEPPATPGPSGTARPSAAGLPPPPGPAGGGRAEVRVASFDRSGGGASGDVGTTVDVLRLLDSPLGWLVPGALVGGPGLLVILLVGLQAVGALAWIPAVRRMGEDDDRRRRRPRPIASRGA